MMKSLGKGYFVDNPKLTTVKDTVVCNFTLVVNEYRRVAGNNVKVNHYFDFELWDTAAQTIYDHARKGDALVFMARPRQQRWSTPEGENRSKVVFRVEEFEIVSRNRNDDYVETENEADYDT